MKAIHERWDCAAYWVHGDATYGPFSDHTRMTSWPDRKNGLDFTNLTGKDVRFSANGVRIMDGVSIATASSVFNNGAFTVYVASVGTDSAGGTQGLISGPNFSSRFVNTQLEGLVTTNSGATGTVSGELFPTAASTVVHVNDVDQTEGNRLYVIDGMTTAWGSRGRNHDLTGAITLAPVKERFYRAIAIFGRAHAGTEMEEIAAALETSVLVSDPPGLVIANPPYRYIDNAYQVALPAPVSIDFNLTIATPDYCTYPEAGAA